MEMQLIFSVSWSDFHKVAYLVSEVVGVSLSGLEKCRLLWEWHHLTDFLLLSAFSCSYSRHLGWVLDCLQNRVQNRWWGKLKINKQKKPKPSPTILSTFLAYFSAIIILWRDIKIRRIHLTFRGYLQTGNDAKGDGLQGSSVRFFWSFLSCLLVSSLCIPMWFRAVQAWSKHGIAMGQLYVSLFSFPSFLNHF